MQKPFYKKWWFWVTCIIILFILLGLLVEEARIQSINKAIKEQIERDSLEEIEHQKYLERTIEQPVFENTQDDYEDWELYAYNMMNQIYKKNEYGYIQNPIHYTNYDAIESEQQKRQIKQLAKELDVSLDRLFSAYLKMYDIKKGVTE